MRPGEVTVEIPGLPPDGLITICDIEPGKLNVSRIESAVKLLVPLKGVVCFTDLIFCVLYARTSITDLEDSIPLINKISPLANVPEVCLKKI